MKHFRRTFALFLALVLLLGMTPMTPAAHAANTVSFSMEGYFDYIRSATLGNMVKEEFDLTDMELDGSLTDSAMTRAAEIFACATENRPDGSNWKSALEEPFASRKGRQFYTFADSTEEAFNNIFGSTSLEGSSYKSIGVGCFSQKESTKAWVVFVSFEDAEAAPPSNLLAKKDVTINILPDNIGADLLHHYFSNAYCACYLIQGTTIGTALQLVNRYHSTLKIIPSEIDYAYTTTDANVFSVDNDAHTITAVGPGTAKLGITIDGCSVPMFFNDRDVEVFETPALSYEQTEDCISVYYGDFPVSAVNDIVLYLKGDKDELWTKGNLEADNTFEHHDYDPTDTYIYVVRYWDDYLGGWVNIGEPLVLYPKDGPAIDPEVTPTPTPTPTPEAGLWLPTEADLPNRTSEPTVDEVTAELERIFAEIYLWGLEWHDPNDSYWIKPSYSWQGGAGYGESDGDAAFAMAVSDLVFGKLPAKTVTDMPAADLRPGDIIITKNYDWHIVLDAAPQYVKTASTMSLNSSGWQEDIVKTCLYPIDVMDNNINHVLTRYTSDSPGVDMLSPSIVPADAEVIASEPISSQSNYVYTYALEWTLTADGTLYMEGSGSVSYKGDTWKSHKDSIKRVVFGEGVTGVYQEIFSDYNALEEVVLSDTVDEIRRDTFINCSNLKRISFGKGLKTIGDNAFQYCGIEELVLPEGLESIGKYAFSGCENLKSLYVPASVTECGNNAFTSCDALEELILADGLTCLGNSAFNHLDSLRTVNIPGSLKTIPKMAFYFSNIETLHIAEGVEVVDSDAFAYCNQLKEVHIPNTVTTIGDSAFHDCENITDVYFYGTEAQWKSMDIGSSNGCLVGEAWGGFWFGPTIHFADAPPCFHKNTTVKPAVEPTCTETGLTEGKICADCGELLTEQELIPALDHDYIIIQVISPTCTTYGREESMCKRNNDHRSIRSLPPTGIHSYENGRCAVCGEEAPAVMETPFTDVSDTDWYFNPVMWAVNTGVTGGKTPTSFAPNEFCTRAQVVTFLYAAAGKPPVKAESNPFTDVSKNDWFYAPVMWAVENGITGGKTPTTFAPNETCTRAQVVTFLYAAADKPAVEVYSPFTDVAAADWYAAPVIWAVENSITGGTSPNTFGPNDNCTRAQVVTFLYANAGKPPIN